MVWCADLQKAAGSFLQSLGSLENCLSAYRAGRKLSHRARTIFSLERERRKKNPYLPAAFHLLPTPTQSPEAQNKPRLLSAQFNNLVPFPQS